VTCYCPACTDQPRETYTEAHRRQCEIDYVLAMPGRKERVSYFALVRQHRGGTAAKKLRDDALALWHQRQESMPQGGASNTDRGVSPTH